MDTAETVRSMIDRENELINHRITWLMTIQGLMFAALGFAWEKSDAAALIHMLCLAGIAFSVVHLLALVSATRAIGRLSDWWETNKPADYFGPGITGRPPARSRILRYLVFWNWVPLIFLTSWAVIWWSR